MGDAGCISYTFPFINLPRFISALLALSSAPRLYLPMPVCKSLLRGYNNPWERFCWLTSVKGHCSPGIKLGQPEALEEGGAITSSPTERMFCRHSHHGEAARLGAVCQPRSCFASLIIQRADNVILYSPHPHWHGDRLSEAGGRYLEATGCNHVSQFAFKPPRFMLCYLEGFIEPHWER